MNGGFRMNQSNIDPSTPNGLSPDEQPKWREDFPINVADDEFGARRDFTKFAVLVSFAFVVGQGWIALKSVFRRRQQAPVALRVGAVDDVPIGGAISFNFPTENDPCILLRTDRESFVAFSSQCTHLMCAVQPDLEHNRLHCPCHAGFFEATSGRPIAGPPRRPLPRITLEIRGGVIYAVGVERRTV